MDSVLVDVSHCNTYGDKLALLSCSRKIKNGKLGTKSKDIEQITEKGKKNKD